MTDPHERRTTRNDESPTLAEILEAFRPQVEKIEEAFTAIRVTMDALASHLQGTGPAAPATRSEPLPVAQPIPGATLPAKPAVQEPVAQEPAAQQPAAQEAPVATSTTHEADATRIEQQTRSPRATAQQPPTVAPAASPQPKRQAEPIAVRGGEGANWSGIVFGEHARGNSSISHLSGSLLGDVYQGDQQAIALTGQLMAFRSGTAEQKARLLKEVGESFYAWRPQGDDDLLQALIDWVHGELDAVQLGNRIQVVQAGDRYDMQRHNAKQPGVEVADVFGWIVLRDNGKVFSKANVAVK